MRKKPPEDAKNFFGKTANDLRLTTNIRNSSFEKLFFKTQFNTFGNQQQSIPSTLSQFRVF